MKQNMDYSIPSIKSTELKETKKKWELGLPARALARVDATAKPGTNVLSSNSKPSRSRSRPCPKAYLLYIEDTSSCTAEIR